MMFKFSILVVGFCLSSAYASIFKHESPSATAQSNGLYPYEAVPEPTPRPNEQELRRRQASPVTLRTVLEAPDNTCGYFRGNTASAWGCTAGENCIFATATITAHVNGTNSSQTSTSALAAGSVLCCEANAGCPAQPAPTACVDMGQYDYNKTCTGSCPHDPMTLKCTSGIYIYCNTVTFTAPDVSALFCNYLSTYNALPAVTATGITTAVVRFATIATPAIPASSTSNVAYSPSAPVVASSVPLKHDNKKAIIGGVVGGVLGLALIVGLAFLFLLRRNSKEEDKPTPTKDEKGNGVAPSTTSPTPSGAAVDARCSKSGSFL